MLELVQNTGSNVGVFLDFEQEQVSVPYTDNFSHIAKNGKLDKFEFAVRMNAFSPVYIDSIQYVLKANDGVAPVITYTGDDTVAVEFGKALSINVSAFDEQENRYVDVEYVWKDGYENGDVYRYGDGAFVQFRDQRGNAFSETDRYL